MRITPLDIQNKTFSVKFRGFNVEEVYAFLEIIREEMEDLLRENATLKENLSRVESQLSDYRNIEATLRETLMVAQQMSEEFKVNARDKADLLLKDAEIRADHIIREAQEKVIKIHEDITDLKGIRRHFNEELRRLIENHLRMLDAGSDRDREMREEVSE